MPRLIVTPTALSGLDSCRKFLKKISPVAAERAAREIADRFSLLEAAPEMGRPLADSPTLRELAIPFASSGYVALYRYDRDDDAVYLLAFRHQREAGY